MSQGCLRGHTLRFKDAAGRREHTQLLCDAIQDALMKDTAENWEPIINIAGVPASKVLSVPEVMESEQVKDRGFFGQFSQQENGLDRDLKLPTAGFKFLNNGLSLRTPPPRVGQDVNAILQALGYSEKDILNLKNEGVV